MCLSVLLVLPFQILVPVDSLLTYWTLWGYHRSRYLDHGVGTLKSEIIIINIIIITTIIVAIIIITVVVAAAITIIIITIIIRLDEKNPSNFQTLNRITR